MPMKLRCFTMLFLSAILTAGCGSVSKNVRNAFPPQYKAGFGNNIHMHVSSFQQGQALPVGSSFAVFVPKEQENDMEYKEYAGLLSAFLVRSGFRPTSIDKADYSVVFTYGIDSGRTEIRTRTFPTYGVIAGGTTQYHHGSIYSYSSGKNYSYSGTSTSPQVYGQTGTATEIGSHRVYRRQFEISFVDLSASKMKNSVVVNSNIKVISEGSSGVLRAVMPFLQDGAVNYVGRSGVFSLQKHSVPFFSATEEEATSVLKRVAREEYSDLLIYSAQNGDLLTVKALLSEGISPDTKGGKKDRSALEWAVYSQNQVVARELLARGATVDPGSIDQAIRTKQQSLLSLLQQAQQQRKTE